MLRDDASEKLIQKKKRALRAEICRYYGIKVKDFEILRGLPEMVDALDILIRAGDYLTFAEAMKLSERSYESRKNT